MTDDGEPRRQQDRGVACGVRSALVVCEIALETTSVGRFGERVVVRCGGTVAAHV